jgi:acetyltransferase-like isoleucine patch superfamily enzyme
LVSHTQTQLHYEKGKLIIGDNTFINVGKYYLSSLSNKIGKNVQIAPGEL